MRDLSEGDAAKRAPCVHRALLIKALCSDIAEDDDEDRKAVGGDVLGIRRTAISTVGVCCALNITMMATTVSEPFEALPYYDDDLQKYPYLEALVEKELARELKASQTLHPSIPPMVEPFAVSEHIRVLFFMCENLTMI
jgi:hypothetical protein